MSMCYDDCGDDNALEGCVYWCTNSGDPVEQLKAERDRAEALRAALDWILTEEGHVEGCECKACRALAAPTP